MSLAIVKVTPTHTRIRVSNLYTCILKLLVPMRVLLLQFRLAEQSIIQLSILSFFKRFVFSCFVLCCGWVAWQQAVEVVIYQDNIGFLSYFSCEMLARMFSL